MAKHKEITIKEYLEEFGTSDQVPSVILEIAVKFHEVWPDQPLPLHIWKDKKGNISFNMDREFAEGIMRVQEE